MGCFQCGNSEAVWDGEDDYAEFVMSHKNPQMGLEGLCLGLAGEVGELLELVKKDRYHGVPMDKGKALKELGDVKFYLTAIQCVLGFNSSDVADANEAKISARYPTGFVLGGGIRGE